MRGVYGTFEGTNNGVPSMKMKTGASVIAVCEIMKFEGGR